MSLKNRLHQLLRKPSPSPSTTPSSESQSPTSATTPTTTSSSSSSPNNQLRKALSAPPVPGTPKQRTSVPTRLLRSLTWRPSFRRRRSTKKLSPKARGKQPDWGGDIEYLAPADGEAVSREMMRQREGLSGWSWEGAVRGRQGEGDGKIGEYGLNRAIVGKAQTQALQGRCCESCGVSPKTSVQGVGILPLGGEHVNDGEERGEGSGSGREKEERLDSGGSEGSLRLLGGWLPSPEKEVVCTVRGVGA